ncbi:MAG TPA: tRNA epoxyqueuosine(34) reductase QueG [Urbifossiella sp.]|nr:tRNA epoxyqueuosine(34) reductase QueG [Urbifossiella sp.]
MAPLEVRLKEQARVRGFALAGLAPATEADGFPQFADWLDRGFAGEMDYLRKHRDARRHPQAVLRSVRSVLMVGMEYGLSDDKPVPLSHGRVAKYAQGPDYHRLLWDRLNDLAAWLQAEAPGAVAKAVADTAPLLERDFARRAGLGWIGKNTLLIHPRRGSFFFLGALLTDRELAPDPPFETTHCGTCTACLDACPTDAFPQPHVLDATRCISYLTIELRSPIAEELRSPLGDWLFGCDICQDVCPWNRKFAGQAPAFPHDPGLETVDCIELLGLDEAAFRARFKGTSLWRTKRTGLLRNAAIVLGNSGDRRALAALQRALTDDPLIADAAAWAIDRLSKAQDGSGY